MILGFSSVAETLLLLTRGIMRLGGVNKEKTPHVEPAASLSTSHVALNLERKRGEESRGTNAVICPSEIITHH